MDQNSQNCTFLAPEAIKRLREERGLTQRQLACALGVTDKAVSKWESGRGLPDITLVEPLACALGVSVAELFAGDVRANANRAGNMLRSIFYVCPICGNVVHAMGEGSFGCCSSAMSRLRSVRRTWREMLRLTSSSIRPSRVLRRRRPCLRAIPSCPAPAS